MDGDDEDPVLPPPETVPAAFSAAVPKEKAPPLQAHTFEGLKGARVVVRANGFVYRGVLIGADEGDLYLRGELRYLVLPLHTVTDVRPEPDR